MGFPIKLNYSYQAQVMIRDSKSFNQAEFEEYIKATGIDVGSQTVLSYLLNKAKLKEKERKDGSKQL